jgi:hypothetical protein
MYFPLLTFGISSRLAMKWDILTHIFGTGNDIQRRNLNVFFF